MGLEYRMKIALAAVAPLLVAASAFASDTNEVAASQASRLHFSAFADVQSSYWARGVIVDENPFSAQFVSLDADLRPFGHVGGYAWSVSSMARRGQSANRQNFYNEVDYCAYYGYSLALAEDWALDSNFGPKWVTLPGYHPHAATMYEWDFWQSLKNPYVTPYYLLRRFYYHDDMTYWEVGLTRAWELCDSLTLTTSFFGELGNSRHFRAQYGPNPNGKGYSNGLMSLNLMVRLDYALTDWVGLYAFVHQFDVVSGDARDALDASRAPEAHKDFTIFGVGITLNF